MLLMMAEKYVLGEKHAFIALQDKNERKSKQLARSHIPLTMTLSFGFGLVLGWMLFGTPAFANYYSTRGSSESTSGWGESVTVDGRSVPVKEYISNSISPENIKENLRFLTEKPHIAGKERNDVLAHSIYEQWKNYGFDSAEMSNYSVLLDYVDRSNYNKLILQDSSGKDMFVANTTVEKPLVEVEEDPNVPPPFNAYSGVGQAKGPLVYVNYGSLDDFTYLTKNLSLILKGHICIARYGKIFRGNKAILAETHGCSGLVIFSDPLDYAPSNGPPIFPNGPMLPPTGVQRGSLMLLDEDPLTPGLPSIDGVNRRSYEEVINSGGVPSIPVQPISYGDAIHFMREITQYPVPEGWQGGLDISYHILQSNENTNRVYLEVNNVKKQANITDVIGVIYGSVEPDHLVILGNHRDAWTFGAVDPNSGTATLMEIARILADMKGKGWRPGRTIVLCSWDAEEYGLIGSSEWVQHYQKVLGANTIAYLNVDVAVSGMSCLSAKATPLLFKPIYDAAKEVACPDTCGGDIATVYDQWVQCNPSSDRPPIDNLGSGSDFTGFVQLVGISSADFTYIPKENFEYYAVYHSTHDNFYWSSNFGDPRYTHHKAIGEVWSRVAMTLATTPILPYDPTDYAVKLSEMFSELLKIHGDVLEQNSVSTEFLKTSIDKFSHGASVLNADLIVNEGTENDRIIRILNNKLMNMERAFIEPEGLPGALYHRHVIMAPSSVNSYAGDSFPGITDAIFDALNSKNWDQVRRQIDIVAVHIMYATQIMEQPGLQWI